MPNQVFTCNSNFKMLSNIFRKGWMINGSSLPDFTRAALELSRLNSASLPGAKQGKGNSGGLVCIRAKTLAPFLLFLVSWWDHTEVYSCSERSPPTPQNSTVCSGAAVWGGRLVPYNVCWGLISFPAKYLTCIRGTRDLLPFVYLPPSPALP